MRVPDESGADAIRYVSITSLAEDYGFVPDDLIRMCREGRVRAEQQNGSWFVDPRSLSEYVASMEQTERERKVQLPEERGPAATDTIQYVATDQSGLTSTSTRTVIVEPATAPPIVGTDDASTSTP